MIARKRTTLLAGAAMAAAASVAGCGDIFEFDNYEEPKSVLEGRVVYQNEPVWVRDNEVQLELWQPGYELNQKIPVHVAQDGTFRAVLFDGDYKLNLLPGNGPWVTTNNPDTIAFTLRGHAHIDVPVTPYYTIEDEQIRYNADVNAPYGAIEATFRVGKVETSRPVEYVGVYVGTTTFVDRINSLSIPNSQRERSGSAIAAQLDASPTLSDPITISVNLPSNIYQSNSPWIREYVFVRVGVKTSGVEHMLFTPVYKINIGAAAANQ